MSKSPTGIIPEELMFPGRLTQVIGFLLELPVPADDKVDVFKGWARAVGVKLSASQLATVRNSGSDRGGPGAPAAPAGGA